MSLQRRFRQLTPKLYGERGASRGWRHRRMRDMVALAQVPDTARIIDLGGTTYNWNLIDHNFKVTIVNLPGANPTAAKDDRYKFVDADACSLGALFNDFEFDFAFSNSTIEHVGAERRQEAFANEVLRLAPAYWVQTPSDRCPIEVHTGVPMYWHLPEFLKQRLHLSWQSKLPAWFEMITETRVLSRQRMQELFPNARLYVERVWGFEKSYAAYQPCVGPVRKVL